MSLWLPLSFLAWVLHSPFLRFRTNVSLIRKTIVMADNGSNNNLRRSTRRNKNPSATTATAGGKAPHAAASMATATSAYSVGDVVEVEVRGNGKESAVTFGRWLVRCR